MKPWLRQRRRLLSLGCAALLLAACGSKAAEPFPSTQQNLVTEEVSLDPVDPNGRCIADLTTTRVIVMTPPPEARSGVVGSATTAEEMRLGAVPSPPSGTELTAGPLALRPPGGGQPGDAAFGRSAFHVYQTPCYPTDVMTFYTEVLRQNQWSGDFVPIGPLTQNNDYIGPKQQLDLPVNGPDPNLTLYDLQTLTSGLFTNVHPTGVTVAWINVVAAIVGPHTGATERHPTYVQVMIRDRPLPNAPPLAPPVSTTPDVGASGGPPGG